MVMYTLLKLKSRLKKYIYVCIMFFTLNCILSNTKIGTKVNTYSPDLFFIFVLMENVITCSLWPNLYHAFFWLVSWANWYISYNNKHTYLCLPHTRHGLTMLYTESSHYPYEEDETYSLYKWGNWNTTRPRQLLKFTQQVNGKETAQRMWLWIHIFNC